MFHSRRDSVRGSEVHTDHAYGSGYPLPIGRTSPSRGVSTHLPLAAHENSAFHWSKAICVLPLVEGRLCTPIGRMESLCTSIGRMESVCTPIGGMESLCTPIG